MHNLSDLEMHDIQIKINKTVFKGENFYMKRSCNKSHITITKPYYKGIKHFIQLIAFNWNRPPTGMLLKVSNLTTFAS